MVYDSGSDLRVNEGPDVKLSPVGWCPILVFGFNFRFPSALTIYAGVLLLLTFCLLLLPLWESVIVLCFVVRYFMSILVLQSS